MQRRQAATEASDTHSTRSRPVEPGFKSLKTEASTLGIRVNQLLQGDCVELLAETPAESVDLAFADPPFNIGYDYDVYDDRRSQQEYLDWCKKWIEGVSRVLKPNGTFWLAIGDEYAAELKVLAQHEVGFHCRSWVIWYYTFGVNCVRAFTRSHTHLFHFVKDPDDYTFNADNPEVRVLSARQLVYADGRANPKGRLPDNTWILRPQDAPQSAFSPVHDTWYYSRVAGTFKEREGFHGCQMPEQLLGRIIRTSSNPMDVVLDPFGGSGTTLAVAKKLGRQWLGFELSEDYARRIQQRLEDAAVGDPLDGPEDPVRSAPKTSKGRSSVRLRNGRPVPQCDDATRDALIEAFQQTADGASVDSLLCDPEKNARFIKRCKQQKLAGGSYNWNRLLLRIRKSGRLPAATTTTTRLSFSEMDPYSFAAEIAMQLVGLNYNLTLDELLCMPNASKKFDEFAAEFAPGQSAFQYRWAALSIRKRAVKARALAASEPLQAWRDNELPEPLAPGEYPDPDGPESGVYVVFEKELPLYVGEARRIRPRLEFLWETAPWRAFEVDAVSLIPWEDPSSLPGLQALLIDRLRPLLNSNLLKADSSSAHTAAETAEV